MSTPVCLSDKGTIVASLTTSYLNTPGPFQLGAQKLQSRFLRQPMNVRALRFMVTCQNALDWFITPAAYVWVQIKVGRKNLTNGFVPLAILSPRISSAAEVAYSPGTAGSNLISVTSKVDWRFDRPLPMGLGEAVQCDFQIRYPDGTAPATLVSTLGPWVANVVAVGETIDQVPASYPVPYAMAFVPAPNQNQSRENDLRNICNGNLEVRRLVGRSFMGMLDANNVDSFWADYTLYTPPGTVGSPPVWGVYADPSQTATFRLLDEQNKSLLAQTDVVWSQAFPEESLCWPMQKPMLPGRGWHVYIDNTTPSSPTVSTPGWIPMLGVIGFREERAS